MEFARYHLQMYVPQLMKALQLELLFSWASIASLNEPQMIASKESILRELPNKPIVMRAVENLIACAVDRLTQQEKSKNPTSNSLFCSDTFAKWLDEKIPTRISQCCGADEALAASIWAEVRSSLLTEDGHLQPSLNFGRDQDGLHYCWNCPKCSKKLCFKLSESGRPHVVNTLQHVLEHFKIDVRKKKRPSSAAASPSAATVDTSGSPPATQRARLNGSPSATASTTSATCVSTLLNTHNQLRL